MRTIHLKQSDVDRVKKGVSPSTVDEVMRLVSAQLGEKWLCAKDGINWYFALYDGDTRVKSVPVRRQKFVQALADATGANVAIEISL